MGNLIENWDRFWSKGYRHVADEIRLNIDSDQADVTFGLLNEFDRDARILEAGCGLGNWVSIFSKMGFNVYGIDISKSSLEIAYNYRKNNNLTYKLLLADLRNIPVKDNYFDLIVSYGAIEHFSDSLNAVKEFYRVLKPEGACLITTPNPFSFHRLIGRHVLNITKSRKLGYVGYEDAYTPKQVGNLLAKTGFKQIRYGILPRGFGCIFGCFWWGVPLIGKKLYSILEKLAFFIQRGQNIFGGGSFAIGYKKD